MYVLDENIDERLLPILRHWRIRARKIGKDIGRKGMIDEEDVIPLLHQLKSVTYFTLDKDYYKRRLSHSAYCLVFLDLKDKTMVAKIIRRFLRHPAFDTKAKRMGIVARIRGEGVVFWRTRERSPQSVPWAGL